MVARRCVAMNAVLSVAPSDVYMQLLYILILARKQNIAGCEWMFLGGNYFYTGWQNYHFTIYMRSIC
jgi:hypothetical protein